MFETTGSNGAVLSIVNVKAAFTTLPAVPSALAHM